MPVTLEGITIVLSLELQAKAQSSIVVKPSSIITDFNSVQLAKAHVLIDDIDEGIVMDVSSLPLKVSISMLPTLDGIVRLVILQSLKAFHPMEVILLGTVVLALPRTNVLVFVWMTALQLSRE